MGESFYITGPQRVDGRVFSAVCNDASQVAVNTLKSILCSLHIRAVLLSEEELGKVVVANSNAIHAIHVAKQLQWR